MIIEVYMLLSLHLIGRGNYTWSGSQFDTS